MRCELSLQPLSAIQPFPESRPLLEAVQAGSNVWDEGAKLTGSKGPTAVSLVLARKRA